MSDEKIGLSEAEIAERLLSLPQWKIEDKALIRIQTFPAYKDALNFVFAVGTLAEEHNHHPDIFMNFKRVTVRYWTHTARGVSALDFKLATLVEGLVDLHYQPRKTDIA